MHTSLIDAVVFACYEPATELLDRVVTVARLVDRVYVVDDGSRTLDPLFYRCLDACPNVTVMMKPENRGIAHSLNLGFSAALVAGARFVMTLDQDTVVDEALFDAMNSAVDELERTRPHAWGAVGPGVISDMRYHRDFSEGLRPTPEIIQSAAVFNSEGLRSAGLTDETLVIDSVDTDLCLRLRVHGYQVFADDRVQIAHPIGSGGSVRILGRRVSVTHHSPLRRYYITRNRLEMFRRYGRRERRWFLVTLRRLTIATILALTIEDARGAKFRAVVAGVRDFLLGHSGPAPSPFRSSIGAEVVDGIAVVLVTHNGMRFLAEQIASIAGQSTKPDAIYLVDDRSSDGSSEFVVDYFATHGPIPVTVVRAPEIRTSDLFTRIAANFEAGLRAAASKYRYIALSDQDDVWEADRLAMQRDRLSSGRALVTVGDGMLIDQDGVPTGAKLRDRFPVPAAWHEATSAERMRLLLRHPMATGAAMMIDSRLVQYAAPVPAGWLHDRWLSLVGAAVDSIDVDARVVVRYRISPSQVVGTRGQVDKSGWEHLADGGSRPLLAARKIGHLSGRLRALASGEQIRAELSVQRVLRSYLGNRGREAA
ncbi:glycosyltransferase [Rhodococcus sp. O3]|uniref:glycosyltransferase n=1 Tax=Rhodococcus sp. O3 TaxID=3404919 RepID=UPI003B677734